MREGSQRSHIGGNVLLVVLLISHQLICVAIERSGFYTNGLNVTLLLFACTAVDPKVYKALLRNRSGNYLRKHTHTEVYCTFSYGHLQNML